MMKTFEEPKNLSKLKKINKSGSEETANGKRL